MLLCHETKVFDCCIRAAFLDGNSILILQSSFKNLENVNVVMRSTTFYETRKVVCKRGKSIIPFLMMMKRGLTWHPSFKENGPLSNQRNPDLPSCPGKVGKFLPTESRQVYLLPCCLVCHRDNWQCILSISHLLRKIWNGPSKADGE